MTAVKARDVERTLRRLDPSVCVLLFYGPNAGLISERARAAAEGVVTDPADPFQLVRLEGDLLSADPARLADETGTIGLFGGKRAIWVKPTTKNIAPAVEAALAGGARDALVVIEAGDLQRSAPLRLCCERSRVALALPCYSDAGSDVGGIIDDAFGEAGLALAPEARAALVASLGSDRLATRREVEKLVLYARGQSRVTLADVDEVVSNVAALTVDGVIDAAFGGEVARVDEMLSRARDAGVAASTILGHGLRHALALVSARSEMTARGRSPRAAVETWRGLHFSRRDAVARQLGCWADASLRTAVEELQQAVLNVRRAPELGPALASAALLRTARKVPAASGRGPGMA